MRAEWKRERCHDLHLIEGLALAIRRRPFYPRDAEDAEKIKSLNQDQELESQGPRRNAGKIRDPSSQFSRRIRCFGGELQSGNGRKKSRGGAFPEWELWLLAGGLNEDGDGRATGKICQSGSLKVSYWEN